MVVKEDKDDFEDDPDPLEEEFQTEEAIHDMTDYEDGEYEEDLEVTDDVAAEDAFREDDL